MLDREAQRASTSKVAFESPEQKGVGLSSILMVQGTEEVKGAIDPANPLEFQPTPTETKRIVPELSTHLTPKSSPHVFFIVYPDRSIAEKPKIQAEFWVSGKLLAKQVADLPAPDASGAIPMVINTAAKLGDCELRITALQGSSEMKQSLKYTVAAQ